MAPVARTTRTAPRGPVAHRVLPRRLHRAAGRCRGRRPEQGRRLRPALPGGRQHATHHSRRPAPPRRRDRLLSPSSTPGARRSSITRTCAASFRAEGSPTTAAVGLPAAPGSSCRSGASHATSAACSSRRCRTRSCPVNSASPAGCSPSVSPGASPSTFARPARPNGSSTPSGHSPVPNRSSTTSAATPTDRHQQPAPAQPRRRRRALPVHRLPQQRRRTRFRRSKKGCPASVGKSAVVTHSGDPCRAAGFLPIAMGLQCTGSIAPGPGRPSDFRHGLIGNCAVNNRHHFTSRRGGGLPPPFFGFCGFLSEICQFW